MSCFNPQFLIDKGLKPNGKHDVEMIPEAFVETEKIKYITKQKEFRSIRDGTLYNLIQIPCGKCIGCRMTAAQDKTTRIMLEAERHKHNYFITLTYDDIYLPMIRHTEERILYSTGEYLGKFEIIEPTLEKNALQDFLKRYREFFRRNYGEDGIKFFYAAEYGDTTKRPHYHLIIMQDVEIPDLLRHSKSKTGYEMYNSGIVEKFWEKGFAPIEIANYANIAYTARYVLKKAITKWDDQDKRIKEYTNMSRRPGLASDIDYKKFYQKGDKIYLPTPSGTKIVKPPKYFDEKLKLEDKIMHDLIKEQRLDAAEETFKRKMSKIEKPILDYIDDLQENLLKKMGTRNIEI